MKIIGRAGKWIATFGAVGAFSLVAVSGGHLIHKVDGAPAPASKTDIDWPISGGTPENSHYSPLRQIAAGGGKNLRLPAGVCRLALPKAITPTTIRK